MDAKDFRGLDTKNCDWSKGTKKGTLGKLQLNEVYVTISRSDQVIKSSDQVITTKTRLAQGYIT